MSDVNDRNFLQPYYFFLALVFSAFPTTANINQTAEEEKFRQLGNLVNTVVYMWNSPFGLSNDEITSLIIKSNIQQDSSTLGSVIRAVLYEITATNSDTPRLPIEPIGSVSASDWKYVKEINVKPLEILLEPEGRNTTPAIAIAAF